MRNVNLLRYGLLVLCFLFFSTAAQATMSASSAPNDIQAAIQKTSKTKKLSIKERWAMKKLKKMQKKQAKKPQGQQLFGSSLAKIFLGAILIVIGAFAILSSIFSLSIGGLLMSIALVVVGALVIAWGALDVAL